MAFYQLARCNVVWPLYVQLCRGSMCGNRHGMCGQPARLPLQIQKELPKLVFKLARTPV